MAVPRCGMMTLHDFRGEAPLRADDRSEAGPHLQCYATDNPQLSIGPPYGLTELGFLDLTPTRTALSGCRTSSGGAGALDAAL